MTKPENREAWLTEFAKAVEPLIKERTGLIPKPDRPYRLACGWPSRGGMGIENATIGQCQVGGSRLGKQDIFISPRLEDPQIVGETVIHEMLHAFLDPSVGHRKGFSQAAAKMGLLEGEGAKPTATKGGEQAKEMLKPILEKLGPYPHDKIEVGGTPKEKSRMLKTQCPLCGFITYTTRKWLDAIGAPVCNQCNVQCVEGDADVAKDPLVNAGGYQDYHVMTTYGELLKRAGKNAPIKNRHKQVPDPRWGVRMHRQGRDLLWWVLDYGDHQLGVNVPRLTPAESREHAIALVEALQSGNMTYEELGLDDDIDVDTSDWEEVEGDTEQDWRDLQHLDEDEEEDPDYEDGVISDEEEAAFAAEEAKREAVAEKILREAEETAA